MACEPTITCLFVAESLLGLDHQLELQNEHVLMRIVKRGHLGRRTSSHMSRFPWVLSGCVASLSFFAILRTRSVSVHCDSSMRAPPEIYSSARNAGSARIGVLPGLSQARPRAADSPCRAGLLGSSLSAATQLAFLLRRESSPHTISSNGKKTGDGKNTGDQTRNSGEDAGDWRGPPTQIRMPASK